MFKKVLLSLALLTPFTGMGASTDPREVVVQTAIASSPFVRQAFAIADHRRANQATGLQTLLSTVAAKAASLSDAAWAIVKTDTLAALGTPESSSLETAFTDLKASLDTAVGTPALPTKSDYIPNFWHRGREGVQKARELLSIEENFDALRTGKTPAGYEISAPAFVFAKDGTIYSDNKGTTLSTALFHVLQVLLGLPTMDAVGAAVMGDAWAHSVVADFIPLPDTFTAPESFRNSPYYRPATDMAEGGEPKGGFIAYLNNGYNLGANHVKPSNCADCSSFVTAVSGPCRADVPYGPTTANFRHLAAKFFDKTHDWDDESKFAAEHAVLDLLRAIYEPIKPEGTATFEDAAAGLVWVRNNHMGFVLGADPTQSNNLLLLDANRDLPGLDGFGIIESLAFDPAAGKSLFFRVK